MISLEAELRSARNRVEAAELSVVGSRETEDKLM